MSAASHEEATARARELQRGWYGEPLGELFRRLMGELGLNQTKLAAALGLSAPMLSQLMSGQRAKIGNPAVVQRLQSLQELAAQTAEGAVTTEEAAARMDEIRRTTGSSVLGTTALHSVAPYGSGAPSAKAVVKEIQSVLRSLASADELSAAADALAGRHPELAQFLRVYGAGRTDEAVAHYQALQE